MLKAGGRRRCSRRAFVVHLRRREECRGAWQARIGHRYDPPDLWGAVWREALGVTRREAKTIGRAYRRGYVAELELMATERVGHRFDVALEAQRRAELWAQLAAVGA